MKMKRRDIGNEETEKLLAELEKEVYQHYLTATWEMKEKVKKFSDELVDEFGKNLVKKDKGEWTEEKFNSWFKTQMDYKQWAEDMVNVLSQDMTNANQIAMSIVNGYMPEVYATNMNYATFDIEHQSKINTSFSLYNAQTVERLIKDKPDLLPQAEVNIQKDLRWNKNHLNNAIIQGTLQGEGISEIAERLVTVVGMNQTVAIRNARTMVTAAQSMGRDDAIKRGKSLGIDVQRVWMARLDFKTRHSHRQLDGEVREVDEPFSNGLMFPGDPDGAAEEVYNCRCRELPVVYGINPLVEGNRINKLGTMSYEDWKEGKKPVVFAKPKKKPTQSTAKQTQKSTTKKATQSVNTSTQPKKTIDITPAHIERLEMYRFKTSQEADDVLRPITSKAWKDSSSFEKRAGNAYTGNSNSFNFPLRGMINGEYVGIEKAFDYYKSKSRVNNLVKLINRSELPAVQLRRGNSVRGAARFLGIDQQALLDKDPNLETLLIGKRIKDPAFFSCGTTEDTGFIKPVNFNVFCPEGTRGIYVEPFSEFGRGQKLNWDGDTLQTDFGGELETLLQRGTEFEVVRVDMFTHSYIDIDIRIVSQEV